MQISTIFLMVLGATAVVAKGDSTGTGAATAAATGTGKGGAGATATSGSGTKATGTSTSKSTRTSGIVMSTGGAISLVGGKREMVAVAGLGVAFAVFM